jgi:hypothetical protein
VFTYKLASLLKVWHPDYLLSNLTAEQWRGWEDFYEQEPWGEQRQDMRTLAQVLTLTGNGRDISLMYPYWPDGDELYDKHKELEAKAADPAHQAKLKEARRKHIEGMKNRGA